MRDHPRELTVDARGFLRAGRPHQIISAAVHYFRVLPEQWSDRLARLRAMGVNTVETYIAWNVHEPEPGAFDFSGGRDVAAFVRTADELGLDVILRPGPYICAEWEFGGLPGWLLATPGIRLRCRDAHYLAAVDRWFDALVPRLVPLQATRGGPVVAMQVENEYGSYGTDRGYLEHLRAGLSRRGTGSTARCSPPTVPPTRCCKAAPCTPCRPPPPSAPGPAPRWPPCAVTSRRGP
nr:beta-galactosidase [Streptomyces sp. GSL17-113]